MLKSSLLFEVFVFVKNIYEFIVKCVNILNFVDFFYYNCCISKRVSDVYRFKILFEVVIFIIMIIFYSNVF